jgi:parvulin-like peptidyl-prolyl isomerase
MLKESNKNKLSFLLMLISLSVIFTIFSLSNSGFIYGDKVIALVNNNKIYQSEAREKLADFFPGSNPVSFEIERMPNNVLESISKEIYINKIIYKEAKKYLVHQNKEIKDQIKKFSKDIIISYFVESLVNKNITRKKISEKYLELSELASNSKEYAISHILVRTKGQASVIIKKMKNRRFNDLAQAYSIDKKTRNKGGNLGYFKDIKIKKEFLKEVADMKVDEVSAPIKTNDGWHILRLDDVKVGQINNFEVVEGKIIQDLKNIEAKKMLHKITKDIKVKILVK